MLFKKLIRTIGQYKAQFISMIIMVAIGVGVFVGFNMEWYSIETNTTQFFEETNLADYRIINEEGFTEGEYEAVAQIDGVDAASRFLSIDMSVSNGDTLNVNVAENYGDVSTFVVTSGKQYEVSKQFDDDWEGKGVWLSDSYAEANDLKIGDSITLMYSGLRFTDTIVALIKCGEQMVCVGGDSQLMPDYSTYGYCYITPAALKTALGSEFYTQINVKSDLSKKDFENKISSIFDETLLVLTVDENVSYAGAKSEAEEGKTMGSILPVLFLLIGVLTMITTMHRITANEKKQIGTLKALGFRDSRILRHYTSYGFTIGLIGTVLGIALGCVIASVIISPNGMMSTYMDLPSWNLYLPWYCWVVLGCIVGLLTLIGYLSVKKMLQGTAADALSSYTPKKISHSPIEKTKAWSKLPFGVKWNVRDIIRHKSRSLMTLIGVIGCMVLLVGGLGLKDTMDGFMNKLTDEVSNYNTRINITDTADNETVKELADQYSGDWVSSTSVLLNNQTVTLEIYDVDHDKIKFLDEDNNSTQIGNAGAYICVRIAETGVKIGDTIEFSPYGRSENYSVKVVGILRSMMTENIVMSYEYAESVGIDYHISAIYTDVDSSDIMSVYEISSIQSKQSIVDSYNSFMEIMNVMVLMFVLAAVVLGTVVLYNLGVMSYIERYRELATLKVVGFRDKHIGKLLIGQNIFLTILGIVIGLPLGVGVLKILLVLLGSEYELKLVLGALTFCVSILVTFGVSLVVGLIVAKKNKKINMVEALKGTE